MIAVIKLTFYPNNAFITPMKITSNEYIIAKIKTMYFEITLKDNIKMRNKAYKKLLKHLNANKIKLFYTKDNILKSYLISRNFAYPDINNFLYIKMSSAIYGILNESPKAFENKTATIITNNLSSISKDNINLIAKYFSNIIIITKNIDKFEQLREELLIQYGVVVLILPKEKITKISTDFIVALNSESVELVQNLPECALKIIPSANFCTLSKNLVTSYGYNIKLKNTELKNNISRTAISALLYYASPSLILPIKIYYENAKKLDLKSIISIFDDENNQKQLKL